MPKKTKKQKILARYRKKIKLLENQLIQPQSLTVNTVNNPPLINKIEEKNKQEKIVNSDADLDTQRLTGFFLSDFRKSLFFTFAIIALEILFYFAMIKNYLKLM